MAKRRTLPQIRQEDGIRSTYRLKSRSELIDVMLYHGYDTGYALAKAARILPGTVNHLIYGRRTDCGPKTAAAIETTLRQRPGELFARVSHGPRTLGSKTPT